MRNVSSFRWLMAMFLGMLTLQSFAQPSAFTYPAGPHCQAGPNLLPATLNSPGSGNFSEITGNVVFANNVTGEIDLMVSTPGTWSIKRVVGNDSTSASFTIVPADDPTFAYVPDSACAGAANFVVPLILGTGGGTFSSISSSLILNQNTGAVDLNNTPPGVYQILYQTAGQCSSAALGTLTIFATADAYFQYSQMAYCADSGTVLPDTIAMPLQGSFHSLQPGLELDSATGAFYPGLSQPGTYTVEYLIDGACPGQWQQTISITERYLGPLFYYPDSVHCSSDPIFSPAVLGPTDLIFYSNGIVFDSVTIGTIDPSLTPPGTYLVMAEHLGICQETWIQQISIDDSLQVQMILSGDTLYVPGPGSNFHWFLNGAPVPGANSNYCFTNGVAGTYTVSYDYVGHECGAKAIFDYVVGLADPQEWWMHRQFYPNPSTGKVHYALKLRERSKVHWALYNSLGIVAAAGELQGDALDFAGVLDFGDLPAGSYRLRLVSRAGVSATQVMLAK